MKSHKIRKLYADRYTHTERVTPHTIDDAVRSEAGRLILEDGNYEKAIELLDAQENIDVDPLALNTRARAKTDLKDYIGAENDLISALFPAKRLVSAILVNLSLNCIESKRYAEAVENAEEARKIDPNWALPYVNLISAYLSEGKVEDVWVTLEEMHSEWPESKDDELLKWHIANDGVISLLRAEPDFEERISKYINL